MDAAADTLLKTRVSELIASDARVLNILIDHGFTPLKNPVARSTLAHTVTLSQALNIAGISIEQEHKLLKVLQEVVPCP